MSEMVKVTGLPEKLPWIEGEDYWVLNEEPKHDDWVRIRDKTGETFQVYTAPGSPVVVNEIMATDKDAAIKQIADAMQQIQMALNSLK